MLSASNMSPIRLRMATSGLQLYSSPPTRAMSPPCWLQSDCSTGNYGQQDNLAKKSDSPIHLNHGCHRLTAKSSAAPSRGRRVLLFAAVNSSDLGRPPGRKT